MYAMLIAGFSTAAMAQENGKEKDEKNEKKVTAPAAVSTAFKKDFPAATKSSWGMEDGNYEAEFKNKGAEQSAVYDQSGHRLETETEIKTDALPQAIRDYLKKNYAAYKLNEASEIVDDKGVVTYEAEIGKGKEKMDLIFDASGNFLKTEKGD